VRASSAADEAARRALQAGAEDALTGMLRHGRAARGGSTGDPPRRGRAHGLANDEHHAPMGTAVSSATHTTSTMRSIVLGGSHPGDTNWNGNIFFVEEKFTKKSKSKESTRPSASSSLC